LEDTVKKALITGHAGFVGRHMLSRLADDGWDVTGIDAQHGLDAMHYVRETGREFDLVIHAAAAGPNRRAIDTQPEHFAYNVKLDASMIEWAARTRQRHFVYLSSSAVYPAWMQEVPTKLQERDTDSVDEPADTYGFTKLVGERLMMTAIANGLDGTIVRPFSGYGTDQSEDFPFRAFIERARRRDDPFKIWGSAEQVRDFIHIDDICDAIVKLIADGMQKPVNLCTGRPTSMGELARMITNSAGYEPDLDVDRDAPLGVFYRVGNTDRLHMHYTPKITLEEGIARALKGH
jgi:nucleoside-diphosphate-sugar epimerase